MPLVSWGFLWVWAGGRCSPAQTSDCGPILARSRGLQEAPQRLADDLRGRGALSLRTLKQLLA
jgi:hypothetical protein